MWGEPYDAHGQPAPVFTRGRGANLHDLAEPALQSAVYALHAREPSPRPLAQHAPALAHGERG
jgi:hypothetical protein